MKIRSRLAALAILVLPCASAADVRLPRSTPEAQGISSQAILGFV
jgi:hypothetical protein